MSFIVASAPVSRTATYAACNDATRVSKRKKAIFQFNEIFGKLFEQITGINGVSISYHPSWKELEIPPEDILAGVEGAEAAVLVDKNIEQGSSDNIHALRLKKDGSFHANSNVMSDDEINELIDLVDEKIRYAGNSILNGDFKINPKQIDKKNESCEHCPYADICFKRNDDLVSINTRKDAEE